jgi:hypothetical protein
VPPQSGQPRARSITGCSIVSLRSPGGIFGPTGLAPTWRLLVVGRLGARLLGRGGRDCRVAAAQLTIDGGDSFGAAPEETSLVLGDLGQRGSEFSLRRVLGRT